MTAFYKKVDLVLYRNDKMQVVNDLVVKEKQLTVFLNNTELTTLLCSPCDYEVLAAGFLVSIGLLQNPAEIKQIICDEAAGVVKVKTHSSLPQMKSYSRHRVNAQEIPPVTSDCQFKAQHLLNMMHELDSRSEVFQLTGGVHSAALADNNKILLMYEDIGRHNAVDKILGHIFLKNINPGDKCLLLSGRIQTDILVKAARGKIPVIVSRAAPAHLAVKLGHQLGITIVGFARKDRLNIYSHAEKIVT